MALLWSATTGAVSGYQFDFAASVPDTYDHSTGGGAFDDATKNNDVSEELEAEDFACGDIVTFLTLIEAPTDLEGTDTLELNYSFTADTTGRSGAAISEVVGVAINDGVVSGGDGPNGTDSAQNHDGGSTATLTNQSLDGPPFESGSDLNATVLVTDVDPGEVIVLRVDVRLACQPNSKPTGNLQASLDSVYSLSDDGTPAESESAGAQTVPFKQFGDLDTTPTTTTTTVTTTTTTVPTTTTTAPPTTTTTAPTTTTTAPPTTTTTAPTTTTTAPPTTTSTASPTTSSTTTAPTTSTAGPTTSSTTAAPTTSTAGPTTSST
ncbi:MAG: hypothetical protein KDB86_04035, partial [Actinobacteria bacterium]|nr:hypothetical protein [Actinomycetota bacterium]